MDTHQEGTEEEGEQDNGRCSSCFRFFGSDLRARRDYDDDETWHLIRRRMESRRERWWKKVKEAADVVAGPKWRAFFRKVGGYWGEHKHGYRKRKRDGFQYDSRSYALNFDDSDGREDDGFPVLDHNPDVGSS